MTVQYTETNFDGLGYAKIFTWALTTADPTGVSIGIEIAQHADLCWQATGTWGGATAAAQGSNTDTDGLYAAVSNANGGAAITWTSDGAGKQQLEKTAFVRPKLTTGGTGATVTVTLYARRNQHN